MDPWPAMEHHARRLLKVYNLINHHSILTLSYVCIDKVFFIW